MNEYLSDDEVVADLISNMTDEDKQSWQKIKSNELIQGHLWTGMSIRNDYKMWHEQNPHSANVHPDDRSMNVMIKIWQTLNPDKVYTNYHGLNSDQDIDVQVTAIKV